MSSQSVMDSIGLGSMLSVEQLPYSLQSFTTAGLLFEYDNPLEFMRMIFVNPEVKESIQANYEQIKTLGRTIPMFAYTNTSGRTITLELHLFADVMPALQVDRKIKWLKTFMYPRDEGQTIKPPKKIVVCMGAYMWLKGVVTQIDVEPKRPFGGLATTAGFLPMLPHYAVVNLTVAETENFFTGGQQTYEQAELEMNYGLIGSGLPSYVGTSLMIL